MYLARRSASMREISWSSSAMRIAQRLRQVAESGLSIGSRTFRVQRHSGPRRPLRRRCLSFKCADHGADRRAVQHISSRLTPLVPWTRGSAAGGASPALPSGAPGGAREPDELLVGVGEAVVEQIGDFGLRLLPADERLAEDGAAALRQARNALAAIVADVERDQAFALEDAQGPDQRRLVHREPRGELLDGDAVGA